MHDRALDGQQRPVGGGAAHRLAHPEGLDRIFFTNGERTPTSTRSGWRGYTGRQKVLSTYRSYHGGTQLAINVTGDPRRWANDTASTGTVHFFGPFLYRSAFSASTEAEECERALAHLEQVIALEGPSTIAAIVLESIPGTAGIMIPPPGYLSGSVSSANRHGIMLVADEVMSGFGRSGRWFAIEHDDVVPDLLTFAKGVNSGYVPLGGVAISEPIYQTFAERPYRRPDLLRPPARLRGGRRHHRGDGGRRRRVVEHAAALGEEVFGPGLHELAGRHEWIGEVRGTGVFWALELVTDRATREPLAPYGGSSPAMAAVLKACREEGLLPFANFNRIHVVPPLTISAEEARTGLDMLDRALTPRAPGCLTRAGRGRCSRGRCSGRCGWTPRDGPRRGRR
ncbi:aminotransferase class III-fold pyridoxal phosphate-dependent enzyme [Nocardioides ungokensis]|uniref:aminotransferase class III-fold pyridoxal phosphate-dependent enzyme n=1 Tax=Nocardioides ungokensis TaxID=1643322 RepID=UPI001FEA5D96|nr:aminotransferase class III-fold pyridoxal phosphate-dependent enzyme [Nocardioides ungokensis]